MPKQARTLKPQRILLEFFVICLSLWFSPQTSASTTQYWVSHYWNNPPGFSSPRLGSHIEACDYLRKNIAWYESRIYDKTAVNQYICRVLDKFTGYKETIGTATMYSNSCPNGHTNYTCNTTKPNCTYGAFNPASNQCVAASDKGQPPQSCSVSGSGGGSNELVQFTGNPVNFLTGNKFHQEVYFHSSQVGGINFSRTYNSADAVWRHSYSDRLILNSDHVLLIFSDGKELRYSPAGSPLDSAAERYGMLSASGAGWRFTTKNQTVYVFDAQGRLLHMELSNGQTHSLSYVSNATSTQVFVQDEFGNQIDFKVNTTGGLFALNAPGITMSFSHNNGLLVKATKTFNGQQAVREYHYEDSRNTLLLTGVSDERGVRYATWAYDAQGRAISSQHNSGADKVAIAYNTDGSSTVTNELNKKTTYRFAVIGGSKRITAIEGEPSANCPNSNSTFTYDERGLLKTKIDNKGILTTYDYNARGLEVSRTEAAGTLEAKTITTEWHPDFFLPTVVTEPDRITRYQYDDQGRQLSRTVDAR